jgi:hypothetical protein
MAAIRSYFKEILLQADITRLVLMDTIQVDLLIMTGIIQIETTITGITEISQHRKKGLKVKRKLMKPEILFLEKTVNKNPASAGFLFDIS